MTLSANALHVHETISDCNHFAFRHAKVDPVMRCTHYAKLALLPQVVLKNQGFRRCIHMAKRKNRPLGCAGCAPPASQRTSGPPNGQCGAV